MRDITDLKWQLKQEREKLDRAQEKLSHTEAVNQSLHEDIDFAKKQIPIVKENLDLQRDIINQINTAQAEVTSNLIYSFKNNFYVYIILETCVCLLRWYTVVPYRQVLNHILMYFMK